MELVVHLVASERLRAGNEVREVPDALADVYGDVAGVQSDDVGGCIVMCRPLHFALVEVDAALHGLQQADGQQKR